jgi:hypothetical protein
MGWGSTMILPTFENLGAPTYAPVLKIENLQSTIKNLGCLCLTKQNGTFSGRKFLTDSKNVHV